MLIPLVVVATLTAEVPADFTVVRDQGNRASLFVYGAWSLATAAVGGVGIATTRDPTWQGVHIGHLVWGGVNSVIWAITMVTAFTAKPDSSPEEALQNGHNSQLAYAINAVFDVATLAVSGAMFLALPDARWQGFAVSSLIQSAFLLAYDVTMSLYHQLNNARARD